jgi:molybdopterin synthase catalytic subunit
MNFITTRAIVPEAFFLMKADPASGALSTFFGIVRNHHQGRAVKSLYYECYVSMANRSILRIRTDLMARYGLANLYVLHRIGHLEVGETALAVAALSAHRAEAFAACEETVERIKRETPIWKKEFFSDGSEEWVRCGHQAAAQAEHLR